MYIFGQKIEVASGFWVGLKGTIDSTVKDWFCEREYRVKLDKEIIDENGYRRNEKWFKEKQLKLRRTKNG